MVPGESLVPPKFDLGQALEVGTHPGTHFFTIGQRRGLNVGGHAEPLFVIGKDMDSNALFVGNPSVTPTHRQG